MKFESEPLFPKPAAEVARFSNMEEIAVEAASRVPREEIAHIQGQAALFLVDPTLKVYYHPGGGLL